MTSSATPSALAAAADTALDEGCQARDLDAARRVLTLEAEALRTLGETLDHTFEATLDQLYGVTGRIIVTGMGKSGHIARKIAATLASTGSPAQFVHPGEASHGDLGMIAKDDAVIALSNSGNTAELTDIVTYTRRFGIPLVGITSKGNSVLARAADLALILPPAPEACPMGLAPTTSTTLMLALGDAMAVALLERRGFSQRDFQVLHPGGALGSKLLRVSDLMHGPEELPLCRPETPLSEAILIITRFRFGCVGVTDPSGQLIGIVTDGDLARHMSDRLMEATAGEIMTTTPKVIRPDALAAEALGVMNNSEISCLLVLQNDRPVGILHMHDCLRAGVA